MIQVLKDIYHLNRFNLDYNFKKTYVFLQKSQYWSIEKLREYQMEQLKLVLEQAYNHVKYYRNLFDEHGISVKQIQNFNDLKKIPYLTKEIIRKNLDTMLADNFSPKSIKYVTTGGSTGNPLGFYIEKRTDSIRTAFEWRNWNWAGFRYGDRCVVLRGMTIKDNWYHYNRGLSSLYLSTYNMLDENLWKYIEKIAQFKPKFIRGYPSTLEILAKFIKNNNISFNTNHYIKGISTSSETIHKEQRLFLEEVFKSPVYDKYGNTEQVGMIGMCDGKSYHDFMEYTYCEFLDDQGRDVETGEVGEIVGTIFTNFAMPFIRYKTGDEVILAERKCKCGREHTVVDSILGRKQDYIITNDLRRVSLTGIIFGQHFKSFSLIKKIQLFQEKIGEVTVFLVVDESFTQENENEIRDKMESSVNGQLKVDFKYVSEIETTQRGKHKFLIQKLEV